MYLLATTEFHPHIKDQHFSYMKDDHESEKTDKAIIEQGHHNVSKNTLVISCTEEGF